MSFYGNWMLVRKLDACTETGCLYGNWMSFYGNPATLRMDQGQEFDNLTLKNLNFLSINVKVGFSHNHQSNAVERFHKTFWALLRAKKSNGENYLEKCLPTLILALFDKFKPSQNFLVKSRT